MDILNKLSIQNLKLNKKRTISNILGITLSVALICAVSTLITSFQKTLVQNAINETGNYHLKLSNVTDDNINELKNNRDIKEIYSVKTIGHAILENGKNLFKPYLKVYSMDESIFKKLSFNLVKGRFPNNSNELIISEHIKTNGKVEYNIGDKIKLNIGDRKTLDNYTLYSSNPFEKDSEKLDSLKEYEFTIVGIIKRPDNSFEDYSNPGYTVITTSINQGTKDTYVTLKNPASHKTSISQILGINNYTNISEDDYKIIKYDSFFINRELLRWEVFAFSDSTVAMLFYVGAIVIFIILFTSIFCIRNSFAIATTEKIKMYGMLASIGATKKQIKKNVIFEAFLQGIIGIPIGIISGILAIFILIKIVNILLGDAILRYVDGIILNISIIPIILSILLGIITIYLSAISSARKAGKVSPIENLRNSDDIKINSKKLKAPKIISKIFKTGGVLAYKNLKRSRKKYRTTVISLTVSIFIFIAMNSFITNMFSFTSNYYTNYDYNTMISGDLENSKSDELSKIIKLEGIDEYFILYELNKAYYKVFNLSKINLTNDEELPEDSYYDKTLEKSIPTGKGKYSSLAIYALDDNSFRKYVKKIGKDYEKVKSTGILADSYIYYDGSVNKEVRRYNYLENDTITGTIENENLEIKVGAVTNIKPYGIEQTTYYGGYLIVNLDEFQKICNTDFDKYSLCINSSDTNKLETQIDNNNFNVRVWNIDKEVKEQKSMILVIDIFIYGFISVITLIGVTNIFNTITSNIELRQKEFAMLKSIGMTKKEFNRMINLETIFYSIKSLIYGILLGLFGTFAFYKAFSVKIDKGMYIPITPIIISIIFVFIIVFIIMKYSINKINKQNTIETIRNENI